MRVSAIQHDIVWEDGPATRAHLVPLIAQAASSGSRLIVLTEMYATGFSMDPSRVAEEPGGPNEQFLRDQARSHNAWLIGSVAQWSPEQTLPAQTGEGKRWAANVAVVAGPHGELHRYDKIHPFSYAGEHEQYAAGTKFLTVPIDDLRVTVFICYDLRFADEFWKCAVDTDVFVVPANWPEPRREHWKTLLRARAIENQAYVIGCNRVGNVEKTNHTGDSAIIDPLGRTLVEGSLGETVLVADIEATEVARVRSRFPFLPDRR
jgi:predicted amidohydrolase